MAVGDAGPNIPDLRHHHHEDRKPPSKAPWARLTCTSSGSTAVRNASSSWPHRASGDVDVSADRSDLAAATSRSLAAMVSLVRACRGMFRRWSKPRALAAPCDKHHRGGGTPTTSASAQLNAETKRGATQRFNEQAVNTAPLHRYLGAQAGLYRVYSATTINPRTPTPTTWLSTHTALDGGDTLHATAHATPSTYTVVGGSTPGNEAPGPQLLL